MSDTKNSEISALLDNKIEGDTKNKVGNKASSIDVTVQVEAARISINVEQALNLLQGVPLIEHQIVLILFYNKRLLTLLLQHVQ